MSTFNARASASRRSPNRVAHFDANPVSSIQTFTRSPESEPDSPPLRTPPTVFVDRAPSSRSSSASSVCSDDYMPAPYHGTPLPIASPQLFQQSPAPSQASLRPSPRSSPMQNAYPPALSPSTVMSPLPLTPGTQLPALIPTPHTGRLSLHPALTLNLDHMLADPRRVDKATLAADATRPGCIKLRIRGPGLLWEVRAMPESNGRTVTVQDVLSSMNSFFDRPVAGEDYNSLRGETREAVKRAFSQRTGRDEVLRSRGIVRRDFLQGRRIVALAPSDREDTVMLVLA
ncbi:hypothetical protein PENSPDRAFT_671041 [Peniophora sp. CONT]|nr:hypothetical protein PENSPDRAFT_671041 [Peniophora sp. CONT]